MSSGSRHTRRGRWLLGLAVAATVLTPVAPAVRAEDRAGVTDVVVETQAVPPAIEIERWWGAVGAIMCGVEVRLIRTVPAVGMNPYVLAAGLGGCVLAVMDLITSE